MNIPSINHSQVNTMMDAVFNMPTFTQFIPSDKQNAVETKLWNQSMRDTEKLVDLGLLEDITAQFPDSVREVKEKLGNDCRLFKVTAMGRAMFQAYTSKEIN